MGMTSTLTSSPDGAKLRFGLWAPLMLAVLLAIATLAHLFVERPISDAFRRAPASFLPGLPGLSPTCLRELPMRLVKLVCRACAALCDAVAYFCGRCRGRAAPPAATELTSTSTDDVCVGVDGGASPKRRAGPAPRLPALAFPCLLISLHIAAARCFAERMPREEVPFLIKWGASWTPLFFVLYGFVLTHSKQRGGRPRPFRLTTFRPWLWRRLLGTYPLFVLSLLLANWGQALFAKPRGAWLNLGLVLPMLQAWSLEPHCTETVWWCAGESWNEPAWFVSVLAFLWMLFPLLYARTHKLRTPALLRWLVCCWSLTLAYAAVGRLTTHSLGWEARERLERFVSQLPLTYANQFGMGVSMGRLHTELDMTSIPALRYAASLAVASLALLFAKVDMDDAPFRAPLLLTCHGLLVLGLALGRDPLARLCAHPALDRWGRSAFAVYLLTVPAMRLVGNLLARPGWVQPELGTWLAALLPALLLLGWMAHAFVQAPVAAMYAGSRR